MIFYDRLCDLIACLGDWLNGIFISEWIIYTYFVTTEDPTFGIGEEIAENTFVGGRPGEEDIPHYYTTREELETLFDDFSEVTFIDKVYEFEDMHGNAHKIVAILVTARK